MEANISHLAAPGRGQEHEVLPLLYGPTSTTHSDPSLFSISGDRVIFHANMEE